MKKIGLKHLNYLTDDFSIWQHTKGPKIDRNHGYSLDDGARALLVALKVGDFDKAKIYLDFLEQSVGNGRFIIFYDKNRKPLLKPCSEDALGEAYWALAACVANDFEKKRAEKIIQNITPRILTFNESRGMSYVIMGAARIDLFLVEYFINQMAEKYQNNSARDWNWLEDELNYANAIIPLAFLTAAEALRREDLKEHGLSMLDFLNKESKLKNYPITIGNKGWYPKFGKKTIFDQQPIDAAYQVLANTKAWELTKDKKYYEEAKNFFGWFWGDNIIQMPLIGEDESCHDGLHSQGINGNCGSESIVCYLLAQEEIWPHLQVSD